MPHPGWLYSVVDRVAQLIQDFNRQAFTDIINQLEALTQSTAPQATAQAQAAAA